MITTREKEILKDGKSFYSTDAIEAEFDLSVNSLDIKNIKYRPCFENLKKLYKRDQQDLSFQFFQSPPPNNRICLILIHGYGTRNKKTYQQLGAKFAARGVDSLVYTLPFHLERAVDAERLNNPDFNFIFEIYRQSIIEIRKITIYLKSRNYSRVGCLGFSFGGYCCSLLAALESQVDFVIPMASLGDLGPIKSYLEKRLDRYDNSSDTDKKLNRFLVQNYLHLISPICFDPLIPKNNILFIQGLLDSRAPLKEVQRFRKKWNWPPVIWYPCDHLTFILFNRITLLAAARFIKKIAAAGR